MLRGAEGWVDADMSDGDAEQAGGVAKAIFIPTLVRFPCLSTRFRPIGRRAAVAAGIARQGVG